MRHHAITSIWSLLLICTGCDEEDDSHPDPLAASNGGACQAQAQESLALCGGDPECLAFAETAVLDCEGLASGKADFQSTSWLKEEWLARGRRCYEKDDYECLVNNFELAVFGWRNFYNLPVAADALENFLTCDKPVLKILQGDMFFTMAGNPRYEAMGWESLGTVLDSSEEAVRAWLTDTDALGRNGASLDIGSFGVVHGWDNIRLAIGRFTMDVEARLVNWDPTLEEGRVSLHLTFVDRYDFHPGRNDTASEGRDYSDEFPYHLWAVALVDEGMACEFDVVGDYALDLWIDAEFLDG